MAKYNRNSGKAWVYRRIKSKDEHGTLRYINFDGDLQKQYVLTDPVPAVRELSEMRMAAIEARRASSESHRLPPYLSGKKRT
jgi:hypothetical protein